jgi:hypothetical protein
VAYNLFLDCAEVCVDTVSGIDGPRPVGGHTNDVHNLQVHDNVFFKLGRSAIEFNNARNEADGNVYPGSASPFGAGPYLRVKFPAPAEWHNLESWREEYKWDMNGGLGQMSAFLEAVKIGLTFSGATDGKPAAAYKGIDSNLFGKPVSGDRMPGPIDDLFTVAGPRSVDPR